MNAAKSKSSPMDEEHLAASKMRNSLARIRVVRFFLYVYLAQTLVSLFFGAYHTVRAEGDPLFSATQLTILAAVGALLILSILKLDEHPVIPALLLALLLTTAVVLAIVKGTVIDGADSRLALLFWAPVLWVITWHAMHLKRLAREHPESYSARWMSGDADGEIPKHQAAALKQHRASRARERRILLVAGLVLVTFYAVGFVGAVA